MDAINYSNLNTGLLAYLAIINLTAFVFYGLDKWKAINHKWRISENTLISLALAGGALGALVGMFTFHHKTRKIKFLIVVPACLLVWIYLLLRLSQ